MPIAAAKISMSGAACAESCRSLRRAGQQYGVGDTLGVAANPAECGRRSARQAITCTCVARSRRGLFRVTSGKLSNETKSLLIKGVENEAAACPIPDRSASRRSYIGGTTPLPTVTRPVWLPGLVLIITVAPVPICRLVREHVAHDRGTGWHGDLKAFATAVVSDRGFQANTP
jgi:hypothetical protein